MSRSQARVKAFELIFMIDSCESIDFELDRLSNELKEHKKHMKYIRQVVNSVLENKEEIAYLAGNREDIKEIVENYFITKYGASKEEVTLWSTGGTLNEANKEAIELIKEDKYDFITVYNGNYDGTMHRYGPESEEAIEALKHNIKSFETLANAVKENWKNHKTLIGFAPDHGCHEIDGGCGSHGLYMPEDMNIVHFYGIL